MTPNPRPRRPQRAAGACLENPALEADGLRNLYRERVIFLFGASCLVVLAHAVDVIAAGRPSWTALLVRLAWAALLLADAQILRRGGARLIRISTSATCLGTVPLYLALVVVTGRSDSPVLPFAYVLMTILPALVFELVVVPLVSSALLMVGIWAILLRDSVGASEMLGHVHVGVIALAVAEMLAFAHRRARQAEAAQLRARRETFERLKDSEMRLALAQEVSHTGSFEVDLDSDGVIWSAELHRIFGVAPGASPSPELYFRLVHPEDLPAVQGAIERALRERSPVETEYRIVRPDGQTRWVHSSGRVLADRAGKPVKLVGTVRDVTEHRRLERTLREMQGKLVLSERMASLGTLAGGVAHEVNNPLSYILSNLRFIAGELADPALSANPARRSELGLVVDETLQGAERVRRIVQDLHAFARPSDRLGPVDVHRILDQAIHIASSQFRFRATFVKEYSEVPLVHADDSRIGQVVLNLLVNAAQAIPEGKPEANEIRVATRVDPAGRVLVEVHDTGCGIPPEIRSRIFEPFFTTKPVGVGTGLGLSICHGIVSSLGGEITVESEAGRGSTFRVALRVAGAAQ